MERLGSPVTEVFQAQLAVLRPGAGVTEKKEALAMAQAQKVAEDAPGWESAPMDLAETSRPPQRASPPLPAACALPSVSPGALSPSACACASSSALSAL